MRDARWHAAKDSLCVLCAVRIRMHEACEQKPGGPLERAPLQQERMFGKR